MSTSTPQVKIRSDDLRESGDVLPMVLESSATRTQIEFAAAIAYLVGSPLQRSQPTALETIQSSILLTNQLLEYGVDPERIIALIHSE